MLKWDMKLAEWSKQAFFEPDLDGELTAIACVTDHGDMFRNLQLA